VNHTRIESAWQKERAGMKLRDTTPRNWIDRGQEKLAERVFAPVKPAKPPRGSKPPRN